jgi:hypothetical protein
MTGIEAVEDVREAESEVEVTETEQPEETESDEAEKPDDAVDEGEKAPETKADATKLTVTLDDDEEEAPPPADKANAAWALKRKREKELERENAELRARLATPATQESAPTLPPMPTAADPDIDYDGAKLATKMRDWVRQEAKVEAHKASTKVRAEAAEKEARASAGRYRASADAIGERVKSYPDAERFVAATLSTTQQNILMDADFDDPARLVLALSQNPDAAKTLAAITSPIKFTKALVDMERSMTTAPSTKKPKAPAEKIISGSGSSAPGSTKLDALEKAAEKTGDYTAYFAALEAQKKKK